MKKHLLTAFSLLLLSTTVTLAQMGSIVEGGTFQGGGPGSSITMEQTHGRGFKMSVNSSINAGGGGFGVSLHLRSDALVMKTSKIEQVGDDFLPQTSELWSIPFPTPAKELEFTAQGELIVRGQNNQILFKATEQPGELLKVTPTGLLKIDGRDKKGNLFILWSK